MMSSDAVDQATADRELMLRFKKTGDRRAFEDLVGRWDRRILAFLTKACGDFETAKDLRQEVFIRVYKYGNTYNPDFAFTTWVYRIARNVLSTWRSRLNRRLPTRTGADWGEIINLADLRPGPRDSAALREEASAVRFAVDGLRPPERELVLLRLNAGLNYREIGEVLETPETTVKSRYYSLLKKLRKSLEQSAMPERSLDK